MSLHQDVLAEIELSMVPSLRLRPSENFYMPDQTAEAGARRRFWCAVKKQEVEVEFQHGEATRDPALEPHQALQRLRRARGGGLRPALPGLGRRFSFARSVADRRQTLGS